jgi:hypothetical protein
MNAFNPSTNIASNFTNWDSWKWWLGFVLGSFFGGVALVYLRVQAGGRLGQVSLTDMLPMAGGIALVQLLCLGMAYGVWKCLGAKSAVKPA